MKIDRNSQTAISNYPGNERGTYMNLLKGIGAILAGIIFIVVSHTGTDFVLERLGVFPPPEQGFHITWMVVTATVYRSLYTVVGGYITAALAPDPPMQYVIILGLIGLTLGTLAAIATIPMKLGPAWYPIALAILALPCVWLGGKLRTGTTDHDIGHEHKAAF